MYWVVQLSQAGILAAMGCICLDRGDFVWSMVYFVFATGIAWVAARTREDEKKRQLQNKRIEQLLKLDSEFNVGINEEEFQGVVVTGEMSLQQLRDRLMLRQSILHSHVNIDCEYFSGSTYLKCAINPSLPCVDCPHFNSESKLSRFLKK
ncbi:MAG TPA: DUF6464 family protein [Cyanophyceae cyanobacterium]